MGAIFILLSPVMAVLAPFKLIFGAGEILSSPIAKFISQWIEFFAK